MTNLVVAMHSEARPLIERYRLEPADDKAFPVFVGRGSRLIVSGVGKVAAAAATAHLGANDTRPEAWLNVGIAGHRDRRPGGLVRAHRITDAATGNSYYPTSLDATKFDSAGVTTVDVPESEFASDDLYDMEAAGFVQTALRFSSSELVQCVKVVSDNVTTGTVALTKDGVSGLIHEWGHAITRYIDHLDELADALDPPVDGLATDAFVSAWHFTTSERRKLTRLLARYRAFERRAEPQAFRELETATDVLRAMSDELRTIALEQREL